MHVMRMLLSLFRPCFLSSPLSQCDCWYPSRFEENDAKEMLVDFERVALQ